jgi:hypothetical protein
MSYQTFSPWGRIVAGFKYFLGTSSNPVRTCASAGRVNLYPNNSKTSKETLDVLQYSRRKLDCVPVPPLGFRPSSNE